MSEVKGEYLYIMQEREDARANRNLFKFGRTAKDPFMNRFKDYPKCSRWWLIIIVDNAVKAETELKRIFKHKFKQRKNDRGDEYYEVDDVQDMMNMVWKYHQEHFENVYMPKVFNGELVFKESMMPLVNHDLNDNIVYFRMADIERPDFTCYLISKGWIGDTKRQIVYMKKNDYEEFVKSVELKLNTSSNDNDNDNEQFETDEVESDDETTDEQVEPEPIASPQPKRGRPPKVAPKPEITVQRKSVSKPTNRIIEEFPVSVERLGDMFVKYSLKQRLHLESTGLRVYVKFNQDTPYLMDIERMELYNVNDKNNPLIIVDTEEKLPGFENQSMTKLMLTQTKMEKLRSVFVGSNDRYVLIFDSLVKKRFRPRGKSSPLFYFPVIFIENMEE